MKNLRKVLCAIFTCVMVFGLIAMPIIAEEEIAEEVLAPELLIFPINQAQILAGAKFDFKVELNNIPAEPEEFTITINDQDATAVFGEDVQEAASTHDGIYKMWENVSCTEAGEVVVKASAKGADYEVEKEVTYTVRQAGEKKAKNVILMIGDGLGGSVRNAARMVSRPIVEGRYQGHLNMEDMDVMTMVTTSGMNSLVTDSANSASAYATGHKTSNNAIGVYTFHPNDEEQVAPKVENIIELAKQAGMSTGIVATSEIEDATPAAMFVHSRTRYVKDQIVDQMLNDSQRPDVILGGGASFFWPQDVTGSKRSDDKDQIKAFEDLGYTFVGNRTELNAVDTANTDQLLGLFNAGNMNVYIDREIEKNPDVLKAYDDQPDLVEMTQTALDILSKNEDGFFLMVEGSSIDKQLHAMQWERAIWDTIEFDNAVGVAKAFADQKGDTLVIVLADHNHSFSVYGTVDYAKSGLDAIRVYEDAGFPSYQDTDGDGFPDNGEMGEDGKAQKIVATDIALLIGWGNHPDYIESFKYSSLPGNPAVDVDGKTVANLQNVENGGIYRTGNLPNGQTQEVHSADDIPLTAYGPGSDFFAKHTLIDNTEVFFAMVEALGLNPLANPAE